MDFVDWCGRVLVALAELTRTSPQARTLGAHDLEIAAAVFGRDLVYGASGFHGSDRHGAINDALTELHRVGVVDMPNQRWWRVGQAGEKAVVDQVALWTELAQIELTEQRRQLLDVLNPLSEHQADDCAWLQWIGQDQLLSALGWANGLHELHAVARELEERTMVVRHPGMGVRLHATYRGLVWRTRRHFTIESRFIDDLVAEWETTSVDFKREVHTDTASGKAELIKDILGLANTQASGARWLVIGFHPQTHAYYGAPDPKLTQDHIEQLLSAYVQPVPRIEYRVIAYRLGDVGRLQVKRDRRDLPYRVRKALGDRALGDKRIEVGDVFVRHGSQTVRAGETEIAALEAERNWALAAGRAAEAGAGG